MALGLLLETCAFSTWAATGTSFVSRPQTEQIALIEHLLDNNLGFSREVSFDDVLQSEESMLSHYHQHDDLHHLFQFKELIIYILASQGEVVKASDKCRLMLSEAESLRYTPGIALAHFALGDVYLNCTMNQEALKEYEAAYNLLSPKGEERSLVELVLRLSRKLVGIRI